MSTEAETDALTWPTRCDMPDLSGLSSNTSSDVALNRMFCGGGPKDKTTYALLMNFNRVVDILIEDYRAARRYLIVVIQATGEVPLHPLLMAIGHFENCITTALRAILFAEKLHNKSRGVVIRSKRTFGSVRALRC